MLEVPYLIAILPGAVAVLYLIKRYCAGGFCKCDVRLDGKIAVVTGSNVGIGKETAKDFAKRGAKVILACRDLEKGKEAALTIKEETGNEKVIPMLLDLSSFKSIRDFADEFKERNEKLDILVNNAGVFFIPWISTEDGYETVLQTNYLGPFLLTILLLPLLKASHYGRIVNVSSHGHNMCKNINFEDINETKDYKKFRVYAQSKLAQILFTRALSKRLTGCNVSVNAVSPGNVDSSLFRTFPFLGNPVLRFLQWPIRILTFKTNLEGAQSSIHCAIAPVLEHVTGKYFRDCTLAEPSSVAQDDELAEKLWHFSLEAVKEKNIE